MDKIETHLLANLNEFLGFARGHLKDPELAADAIQESLLKAVKSVEHVRDEESTKAWFYRILRRTIIDLYRHKDVQRRALDRLEQDLAEPPSAEAEQVICACLGKLLPTLKPEYSSAVQRLDLNGEGPDLVAASLGVTRSNLNVRLHRARKQLKERLTQTCRMCATHGCLDCTCDTQEKEG
jgi:RNA polymerase sigma-70 factor (ECF subfamily)